MKLMNVLIPTEDIWNPQEQKRIVHRPTIAILYKDKPIHLSAAYETYESVQGKITRHQIPQFIDQLLPGNIFLEKIKEFSSILEFIEKHNLVEEFTIDKFRYLPPVIRARKIIALGRNYAAHALEHAGVIPTEPIIFGKVPSSIIAHEEPVIYKKYLTRVDPEAELAVIIARGGKDIPEERAMDCVAGYTCLNDVTARDIQHQDIEKKHPWFRSKSIDTFCPLGPCLLTVDEIQGQPELALELRVNGEIRQKDNTRSMLFKIPKLIAFISQYMTLEPGDIIATGTPEGMKPVKPGDVMEVTIDKIGTLRNPVVAEA